MSGDEWFFWLRACLPGLAACSVGCMLGAAPSACPVLVRQRAWRLPAAAGSWCCWLHLTHVVSSSFPSPRRRYTEFIVEGGAPIHLTGYYMPGGCPFPSISSSLCCWRCWRGAAAAPLPRRRGSSTAAARRRSHRPPPPSISTAALPAASPAALAAEYEMGQGEDDSEEDEGAFPDGQLLGYDEASGWLLLLQPCWSFIDFIAACSAKPGAAGAEPRPTLRPSPCASSAAHFPPGCSTACRSWPTSTTLRRTRIMRPVGLFSGCVCCCFAAGLVGD